MMISETGMAPLGIVPGMVLTGLFLGWERVLNIYNYLTSKKKKG